MEGPPPQRIAPPHGQSTAMALLGVVAVAALYLGRDIFIPMALAVLLSFALAPAAIRLRRLGLGRAPSVIVVVLLALSVIAGFGVLITNQIDALAENIPTYERNLRAKIRSVGEAASSDGVWARIERMSRNVTAELEKATNAQPPPVTTRRPQLVEVHEPPPAAIDLVAAFVGRILHPLTTAGIMLVFVVFFLLNREDLRDRFIRLVGASDVHRTTAAMTDAGGRVSRYLLVRIGVTTFYGVVSGLGLWAIGVPLPLFWGLFGGVLRLAPFVGPILGSAPPIASAMAIDPGWSMLFLSIALYAGLELTINYILDPWLYGTHTGLSPVAVLTAAVFWSTLWGPIGLLLATPLTVCLVVLGRHVPQLQFLDVLFGREPVLAPEVRFYQRLLAEDVGEALDVAEDVLEERPIARLYDEVALPALTQADRDRLRGALGRERAGRLAAEVVDVARALGERDRPAVPPAGESGPGATGTPFALCVGARNRLDEAAAALLVDLCSRSGLAARSATAATAADAMMSAAERRALAAVCVVSVNPETTQHCRRLAGRIRARLSVEAPILIVRPGAAAPADHGPPIATSLASALRAIEAFAHERAAGAVT